MRVALLIVLITLASCATITLGDAGAVSKGMSQSEIETHLGSPGRTFTVTTSVDKQEYIVKMYSMSVGQVSNEYFLSFYEDKLFFWGYLHEFARSENPEINSLGVEIRNQMKQWGE